MRCTGETARVKEARNHSTVNLGRKEPAMSLLDDISSAVQRGKKKEVTPLVQQAHRRGDRPGGDPERGPCPRNVGDRRQVQRGTRSFVPEMLVAARAMSAGTELLKPLPRRVRQRARRQGGHRHGAGRHARHRQEPRAHDDREQGLRDRRPRGRRGARDLRVLSARTRGHRPRVLLRPAHHHHALHRGDHRRHRRGRACATRSRSWSAVRR